MKYVVSLVFIFDSSLVLAYDEPAQIPVETYHYGMKLDVAQLIHVSPTPKDCAPHWIVMDYKDSAGERHRVKYRMLGSGCSRH
ncbi:DUF2790 domain-containing protein [Pseudomonas putida]|uniref:DUF2790 domain-containing protein n=2 Tax=Pseudomonas TaxID=286 RepID=UPI0018D90B1C|nr:DUF2790 domain-containing protein [Pseudomonas putida]